MVGNLKIPTIEKKLKLRNKEINRNIFYYGKQNNTIQEKYQSSIKCS